MIARPRLRSLRNKLALVFFAITAAAFSAIYFYVVPQLESNLEQRQLDDLRLAAEENRLRFETAIGRNLSEQDLKDRVSNAAEASDARVTLLRVEASLSGPRDELTMRFPLLFETKDVPLNRGLAMRAVNARRPRTDVVTDDGQEFGQVAQPIEFRDQLRWVVIYSRDFEDVTDAVSFVRNRVLLATGAALLIALLGGYLVARRLAQRVRRLELAAGEVAQGRFIEPLPVDSRDELGALTRTFNEMQVQLRQLDVARKEFIATASHELRTPIFSLAGFVELLQHEDMDDDTRREFIDTMSEQVARLQKLSVNLLDLSRLDSGSVELHDEPVDLAELARSVLVEFAPAIADHDSVVDVELPEEGPEARCDRERVAQIMRILLDNALRHTPTGTHVAVRANRGNGAAGLTVADTGPGLPGAARNKVFERFYTGDATRGAGLGLAIAHELAERMEGRLVLTSTRGKTAFTLKLPAEDGDR